MTSAPFDVIVDGVTMSGRLALAGGASHGAARRATVAHGSILALHGHGMTSAYFDGPADPDQSLLTIGAAAGFNVWAPDRPGYGAARDVSIDTLRMERQGELMTAAMAQLATTIDVGGGWLLVGHSFGLKMALCMAANWPASNGAPELVGVAGAGTGVRYGFLVGAGMPQAQPGDVSAAFGPAALYPEGSFRRGVNPSCRMAPIPDGESAAWPEVFRSWAARISVPVRFTYGDHERLWPFDDDAFAELRAMLPNSPRVECNIQRGAGHNVSLSRVGGGYHRGVITFFAACLSSADAELVDKLRPTGESGVDGSVNGV
jgi:pimeloyl-ACP methyl ester carboxylesterase